MLAPSSPSGPPTPDLGVQLCRSYDEHPRFRSAQPPWVVDTEVLDAFDDAIAFVRARPGTLTGAQFTDWSDRCRVSLSAIFDFLSDQARDPLEQRFVAELHAECRRLLDENLALYARPRSGRGIALSDRLVQDRAMQLDRDAHFLAALPRPVVEEILHIGAQDLDTFRRRASLGQCTRNDLSVNAGPSVVQIARRLNTAFDALGILDAVGGYMGRRTIVGGVALELSVPQAQWWANSFDDLVRAPATLYAHVDESIAFPKAIVYLSDVGPRNGPTSCYPQAFESLHLRPLQEMVGRVIANVGNSEQSPLKAHYAKAYHQSMSSEPFRRHFMRLPRELRFNSHFGWDVLPDSAVEHALIAREQVVSGTAGSFIVFDGAKLLHRGGMVEDGERIALQVVFAPSTISTRLASTLRAARA